MRRIFKKTKLSKATPTEASREVKAQVCDYKRDRLRVPSPLEEMKETFKIYSFRLAALNSAIQHAISPDFGEK